MLIFFTGLAAATASILCSIAGARHWWATSLVASSLAGSLWLVNTGCIMCELENPTTLAPCLVPSLVQAVAGVVGLVKLWNADH